MTQAVKPAGPLLICAASPPQNILVVDDDRDLRRINAAVLQRAGYRVDTAEDGAMALEALGDGDFDLLITDNNMPNLTGMELLKSLYATHMTLPCILATGNMPEEEFSRYPWLLPAATLRKPYSGEELLGVVKKVLRETDIASTGSPSYRFHDLKINKVPRIRELASVPVQSRTSPPRRILVVEDEPDMRRLNAEVLQSFGYQVDTAEDGKTGWEALHATRHAPKSYALLITDHDMPGLSGVALVKKARAARMALPVIMATGTLPPEDMFIRYPWLQPAATLIKPYSVEQLLGTVEAVLRTTDGAREPMMPLPSWPPTGGLQL